MPKAKKLERIGVDDLHPDSEEFGMGSRRWPDGKGGWNVHHLGDHEMVPAAVDEGDWHQIMGHPGFEYRTLLCRCGYPQMEGREAPDPPDNPDLLMPPKFALSEPPSTPGAEPSREARDAPA